MFDRRKYIFAAIVILLMLIFISRLFYLQIVDEDYAQFSQQNILSQRVIYPSRGLIYDRQDRIMVANQTVYDLMVTPSKVSPFDTAKLAELLDWDVAKLKERLNKARNYSFYKPSIFARNLTISEYGPIQEKLYVFRGFYSVPRTNRKYLYPVAPQVMGYLGEVDKSVIEKSDYYELGDYKGLSGIEEYYEPYLRGSKGVKHLLVDVFNREQGNYKGGELDKAAIPGKDLHITLDAELQAYGEKLMKNKIGSVVAIEPSTGEILAMVSSPGYEPEKLVGRKRGLFFPELVADTNKPLYNRPIKAQYPPGSTFKTLMALIGLKEEVINPYTQFTCRNGFYYPGIHVGCHSHDPYVRLNYSIETSCNAYYCNVFRLVMSQDKFENSHDALQNWHDRVAAFGLGDELGLDVHGEEAGNLPGPEYYDSIYRVGAWKWPTVVSLSIGQGELGVTPLQMANFTSAIANRGYYITPHLLKTTRHPELKDSISINRNSTGIDRKYFELVVDAMYDVVEKGTARWYGKVDSLAICGKTGTAQNPHGEDHSIFIAFAPKDDPKIAIATVVENSGYGSVWAAPVSTLMIEKYLKGESSRLRIEKHILDADFINPPKKEEDE